MNRHDNYKDGTVRKRGWPTERKIEKEKLYFKNSQVRVSRNCLRGFPLKQSLKGEILQGKTRPE